MGYHLACLLSCGSVDGVAEWRKRKKGCPLVPATRKKWQNGTPCRKDWHRSRGLSPCRLPPAQDADGEPPDHQACIVVLLGKRIRRSCDQVVREWSGNGHVVVRSARVLVRVFMPKPPGETMTKWGRGRHHSVVYLHLTDNSEVGKFGTMVSFHHRERGHHHGTAPVVVPTPPGRSRGALPPHACLVA